MFAVNSRARLVHITLIVMFLFGAAAPTTALAKPSVIQNDLANSSDDDANALQTSTVLLACDPGSYTFPDFGPVCSGASPGTSLTEEFDVSGRIPYLGGGDVKFKIQCDGVDCVPRDIYYAASMDVTFSDPWGTPHDWDARLTNDIHFTTTTSEGISSTKCGVNVASGECHLEISGVIPAEIISENIDDWNNHYFTIHAYVSSPLSWVDYDIHTVVQVSLDPIVDPPTGDCSGVALSPIAQAVLTEVGSQNYCGNFYDGDDSDGMIGLISLPPGQAAFERFANLAKTADYEIDFVTMGWDVDKDPENVDSPGDFFLQGIQELYEDVQENPGNYANGVRVRILLGLKRYHGSADQRLNVLNDLSDLDILEGINWEVEVAYHDHFPLQHSHVKMMIVDGKHVITGGYNLHYNYLEDNPIHDMGIEVSGPIVQDALQVFDNLWMGGHVCTNNDCSEDTTISVISHDSAMLVPTVAGNTPVFSLFRDNVDKAADNAIEAAMSSARSKVNIIQNRFMNSSYYAPPQYVRGILNAIDNGNVYIKLLASSGDGSLGGGLVDQLIVNTDGICVLHRQIVDLNGGAFLLPFFDARLSTTDNPIHTKALSIDDSFVIVGSQNFDLSAWENNILDLAEYSLGVDSIQAAGEFQEKFTAEWDAASAPECLNDGLTGTALQDSINQASPGTVMFIPAGVYTGSVTINKPLVLVGAGANQTIIQPEGNEPAFQITSSDVVIANMKISGGDGYGIELIDTSPSSLENIQIHRVVFENNALGGVLAQGLIPGSPMDYAIENSTFIGGADGITINMLETQAETSVIRDNIFSGQSNAPIHILSTDDSRVEYSYNLFDDCGLGACATNWVQGNISALSSEHDNLFDLNPLFASPENGAYQLSTGSPAIDAGDPDLFHDFFFDGDDDGFIRIDMGAFEYAPIENVAPVVDAGNDQTVDLGESVILNATYSDADNTENHSARIDWGDGMVEDVAVTMTGPGTGEVNAQHMYSSAGNYTVEVCVTDLYGSVGCDTVNVEVLPPAGVAELHIGETYVLPYDDHDNGDMLVAQHTTLSQEATIQSLSFYVTQAAGKLRLGIYDDANGNPGTLVAKTDEFTPAVGWNTHSVQVPTLLPAGAYWLAYLPESDNLHVRYGWPGLEQFTGRYYNYSYGELPAVFSSSAQSGEFQFSFYATFTVTAEPGTVFVGEVNVLHDEMDGAGDLLVTQRAELPSNAVVQSLSFYVTNAVGKLRLGIYDNNSQDRPGTLMAQTDEFTPVAGWNTVNVQTPTLLPAGTYWLSFLPESDALRFKYEWIAGLYTGRVYGYPFGDMPSMIVDQPFGVEYRFSLYATFIEENIAAFPTTGILDDFNRADGAIGSDWSGYTSAFSISSNQLKAETGSSDSYILWGSAPFGADQEAYVTIPQVDTQSWNLSLLLKSQGNTTYQDGFIEVYYQADTDLLQVWSYDPANDEWVQYGAYIPVVLSSGDQFGARARADGLLEIYKNGSLFAVRNVGNWAYSGDGGYIGLWFANAVNQRLDDFGGGTIFGGESLMMQSTAQIGGDPLEGSSEFMVPSSRFKAGSKNDLLTWQGTGETAYVIFPSVDSVKQDRFENQQRDEVEEGAVKVIFDMAGGRIRVLIFDSQGGWAQPGKDILVKFVEGDRFRAFLYADGVLEIRRNGKLLVKRDVTP